MSLTDSGSGLSAADVAAVTNGRNGNGFGFGGDGAWWKCMTKQRLNTSVKQLICGSNVCSPISNASFGG